MARPQRGGPRAAFTLIELLVVVAVITILAALLAPTVMRGIAAGQSAACKSNLQQIGDGVILYLRTYDHYLPTHDDDDGASRVIVDNLWWHQAQGRILLMLDTNDVRVFHCTGDAGMVTTPGGKRWFSYTFNTNGPGNLRYKNVGQLEHPSRSIIFMDGIESDGGTDGNDDRSYQPGGATSYVKSYARHMGGFNALFIERHIEYFRLGETTPEDYKW